MRADPARQDAQPTSLTALRTQMSCLRFTTSLLVVCLFFQRFGVPFGGESLNVAGPAGLCLAGWGLARGTLVLHRQRLILFLMLTTCVVLGAMWRAFSVNSFDAVPSTNSMLQFLLLTGFATATFSIEVEERAFFQRVNALLMIIAAAGIGQFCIQFIGVKIFAFGDFLPERMLFESGYNLKIPVGIGDVLKSNGFFLVEPSVLSQFMAIALIIEVLNFRRPLPLMLFVGALLLSFSGTGWIVLAAFLLTAALRLGRRGVVLTFLVVLVLGVAATLATLLAPQFAGAFAQRINEVSTPGTSGFIRFVTPFWLVDSVLTRVPSALFFGIGAGVSEKLSLPFAYAVNTPIKIMLEYGLPALAAYIALFCVAHRTALQAALLVPCLVWFMFTGGYQQFGPILFPVLLLVVVARLRPLPRPAPP